MNRFRGEPQPQGRFRGERRGRGGMRGGGSERPGKTAEDVSEPSNVTEKTEEPELENGGDEKGGSGYLHNERKFSWRCRLFVGNVPGDTTEEEFLSWFEPFGEVQEPFVNARKAFGFVRVETREIAEAAKKSLDGKPVRGRYLRVRHSAHGAAIRVKYVHSYVSNEYLMDAFSSFGDVERAIVCSDDKGKPTGEAIIEFAKKPAAMQALKRISEGVFLLGSTPRPVVCELLEHKDEEDGVQEIFVMKNNEYYKEREQGPHFSQINSFEFKFGQKWKELYAHYEEQKRQLEMQFEEAQGKLELEETQAQMEHQTAMMRQELLRRQEELRMMEEQQQTHMQRRMDARRQQEDMRRHQMMGGGGGERRMGGFPPEEGRMDRFMGRGGGGGGGGPTPLMDEQIRPPGMGRQPLKPPPMPPSLAHGGHPGQMMGPGGEMGNSPQGMRPPMGQGPPGGMRRKPDADYRQSRFEQQKMVAPPLMGPPRGMGGGERGGMGGGERAEMMQREMMQRGFQGDMEGGPRDGFEAKRPRHM